VFGMFTGAEQMVKLKFASHLVGAVIDRFGKDIMIIPRGQDYFAVDVPVAVSPQFFGWVFGFGGGVEILYPDSVREEMKQTLRNVAALYAAEEPED